MDQNTSATVQVADYVSQLFPNFGPQESNAVAAQYAGLGTNIFQVNAIMGECEYSSLKAKRQLVLILIDSNFHLSYLFFITWFWRSRLQGLYFFLLFRSSMSI